MIILISEIKIVNCNLKKVIWMVSREKISHSDTKIRNNWIQFLSDLYHLIQHDLFYNDTCTRKQKYVL